LADRPKASILRGFSAPVILEREMTAEDRAFLLAHDTDPFNKWEAGRQLAKDVLTRMVTENAAPGAGLSGGAGKGGARRNARPRVPGAGAAAAQRRRHGAKPARQRGHPDPLRIHAARRRLARTLAEHLSRDLPRLYDAMLVPGPYSPDARAAGCRALRLTALSLMSHMDGGARAAKQFAGADNMTEQLGALSCLLDQGVGQEELAAFHRQWRTTGW
jgi:aminopeptidase N